MFFTFTRNDRCRQETLPRVVQLPAEARGRVGAEGGRHRRVRIRSRRRMVERKPGKHLFVIHCVCHHRLIQTRR